MRLRPRIALRRRRLSPTLLRLTPPRNLMAARRAVPAVGRAGVARERREAAVPAVQRAPVAQERREPTVPVERRVTIVQEEPERAVPARPAGTAAEQQGTLVPVAR